MGWKATWVAKDIKASSAKKIYDTGAMPFAYCAKLRAWHLLLRSY